MSKVFLPRTDFPIRAQLPEREPDTLAYWREIDLYRRRAAMAGEPFVLHDGPPYANGNIHLGHALNKILKDFVVRTRFLLGHSVAFTPGWDCHGLPIEWEVEKAFRAEKRDKNAEPEAFRQACRNFAGDWVSTQSEQFQRLGVLADWDNPYRTMDFATEAKIVETFHTMVERNLVYRARRPVLWSSVERTAMASAETEDQDHQVPTTWFVFPIVSTREAAQVFGGPAFMLVWTTTPWSLPGNMALAVNTGLSYGLYDLDGFPTVMADFAAAQFPQAERKMDVDPAFLLECRAISPLDSDKRVPIYHADYVTSGKGSGIVHVGPASSVEDWRLWTSHNPVETVPEFIGPDGRYAADLPRFGGMTVVKNKGFGEANDEIIKVLGDYLIRVDQQTMKLKHSWRSKGLLIENATPQWFVRVEDAFKADLDGVSFIPEQARNRFESKLSGRPDWLVSRQRMWGTPLALFQNTNGEPLVDPAVNKRIQNAIEKHGIGAWFNLPKEDFLGDNDPDIWTKVEDVLDVWFDSGCVHQFSDYEQADLYLEGSDQH